VTDASTEITTIIDGVSGVAGAVESSPAAAEVPQPFGVVLDILAHLSALDTWIRAAFPPHVTTTLPVPPAMPASAAPAPAAAG